MKVHYKLQMFEGPLDLLLHLVEKAEVDIYDIPISKITEQYMEYLSSMKELELDITSEFLVMAATLLSIKSKMLLPKPPVIEDEWGDYEDDSLDPRAELIEKLLEYKKYKTIAEMLREKEVAQSLIYTREPEDLAPYIPDEIEQRVKGLHLADIMVAFQKVLRRAKYRDAVAMIHRDEITVKDRIRSIIDILQARGGRLLFSQMFPPVCSREEIVVTFLAILELMKVKHIICFQDDLFEDIVIQSRGERLENGFFTDEINY